MVVYVSLIVCLDNIFSLLYMLYEKFGLIIFLQLSQRNHRLPLLK